MPLARSRYSPMMLRAELPVHRIRVLNGFLFSMDAVTELSTVAGNRRGDRSSAAPKAHQVAFEHGILSDTVLEASQVGLEFRRALVGQPVNDPVAIAAGIHQSPLAEVGEMLGHLDLMLPQHGLEVADAKGSLIEEVKNPQSRQIAQALVDLEQLHNADVYS